jgi:phosphate starvation-inducible PhoH-like protein
VLIDAPVFRMLLKDYKFSPGTPDAPAASSAPGEAVDAAVQAPADNITARPFTGQSQDDQPSQPAVRSGDEVVEDMRRFRLLGNSRKGGVVGRTPGQLAYLNAMAYHELVFGVGPAGTGKTYLAMARALDALKNGEVRRLVLTRPAVEAGEALGFLPGDFRDKVLPYLRPLYDAIYDMLPAEEAERLIERGTIEVAPLAYMRGRTLGDAFVILDEGQNTTPEQMFMFLTRLGEGSRCVVTGDPSQWDTNPTPAP